MHEWRDMSALIEVNAYQVEKAAAMLANLPNGAKRALAIALNRAITGVRTDAVKQITETYTIKSTIVRDSIAIKKASINNLAAIIKADGAVIPITKFKINIGRASINGKSRPILRATVKHGDTKILKHGFTANMGSGHNGVFLRTGKERLPIKQVFSLSIPQMLGNKDVQAYLEENASDRLDKAVEHETNRLFRGIGS